MKPPDLIARLKQGDYGDSATEVIALAKAAATVNNNLYSPDDRADWLDHAGIHPDTWAKLAAIARAEHLHEADVVSMLPPSFSTLSLLSRCSKKEFKTAMDQGLITPKLTHRALSAWRKEQESKQPNREPVLRLLPMVVALDPQADAMDDVSILCWIHEAMDKLSINFELIHLDNWEDIDAQAVHQWRRARLMQALEQVNHQISPKILTMADLSIPLGELKEMFAGLDREQWASIHTLKNAHDAVYAPTKQKRYASRIRIQRDADQGNELARALTRHLLGTTTVQAGLFDQNSKQE